MDSGNGDDIAKTSDGTEVKLGELERTRRRTGERLSQGVDKIPWSH